MKSNFTARTIINSFTLSTKHIPKYRSRKTPHFLCSMPTTTRCPTFFVHISVIQHTQNNLTANLSTGAPTLSTFRTYQHTFTPFYPTTYLRYISHQSTHLDAPHFNPCVRSPYTTTTYQLRAVFLSYTYHHFPTLLPALHSILIP